MKHLLLIPVFCLWMNICTAAIIHVPDQQPTIQAGIDAAIIGDTVLVAEGTYTERIQFGTVAITLAGEYILDGNSQHISATVIDGDTSLTPLVSDTGSVVIFHYGIDSNTLLIGFTIINGIGTAGNGGGILVHGSPMIRNCVVRNNSGDLGAGIYCDASSAKIDSCRISDNAGEGITCDETSEGMLISDCIIKDNSANGLEVINIGFCEVSATSFLNNGENGVYNGLYHWKGEGDKSLGVTLADCLIEGNVLSGVKVCDANPMSLIDCNIRGNMEGGIFLCNYEAGNAFSMNSCLIDGNFAANGAGLRGLSSSLGSIDDCIFSNNMAQQGGAIFLSGSKGAEKDMGSISNCTFVENHANVGSAMNIFWSYQPDSALINNCIIAFNGPGEAVYSSGSSGTIPVISCTDIYGNQGGDWTGPISDQSGMNGNISEDPLFCDTSSNDYHIYDVSPCTPQYSSCDALIGALGVGCNVGEITELVILNESSLLNVTDHTPTFSWVYSSSAPFEQNQFEIELDANNNWQDTSIWNPAQFESPDTFVVYDGETLIDGQTYYLRLRIADNGAWSNWFDTSFRMNSAPSIPVLISPINDAFADIQPLLSLQASADPEDDALYYIFQVLNDAQDTITASPPIPGLDNWTAVWQCDVELIENEHYSWEARATDTYEESSWSAPGSFYVNSINMPPLDFMLIEPSDSGGVPIPALHPIFRWSPSIDSDPLDSVSYTLIVDMNSDFDDPIIQDTGIYATEYIPESIVPRGGQYWWKVMAIDREGAETHSSNILSFQTMICGDANLDSAVSVTDAVYLINYVFVNGDSPLPFEAGDVNCDGSCNVSDAVLIINHVFLDGKPPCDLDEDLVPDC